MIDNINRATRQLRVVGSPVDTWEHILVYGVITRMPPRTLSIWETTQDLNEMPKLSDVLEFLEKRARGQLNLNQSTFKSPNQERMSENWQQKQNSYSNDKPFFKQNLQRANDHSGMNNNTVKCNNCNGAHTMYSCQKFKAMSLDEKKKTVREKNLCWNCFSPNHRVNSQSCKAGTCKRCNKGLKHNSLLCNVATMTTRMINFNNAPLTTNTDGAIASTLQQASDRTTYQPPHWTNNGANLQNFQ